ncbi:hypothetical protein PGT21_025198 [Puccinia graminis f. sp. tritici]|uniref:Uncharacterized protein n=1 Tax=Puccinia graminis f. sp. tritici TaxID=56615 RepID=A0A5B0NSJ3_PUCGR|nr:hypothetical protein PGT21_025198 [Puccinia graminis f. sp. tritici]
MDDHREAQLDSQRDRSDDDVMDIDVDWKHRLSPTGPLEESALGPDTRDEAERGLCKTPPLLGFTRVELIPISLSQTSEGISIPYSLSAMNQNNPRNLSRKDLQHRIESSSQAVLK